MFDVRGASYLSILLRSTYSPRAPLGGSKWDGAGRRKRQGDAESDAPYDDKIVGVDDELNIQCGL